MGQALQSLSWYPCSLPGQPHTLYRGLYHYMEVKVCLWVVACWYHGRAREGSLPPTPHIYCEPLLV